MSVSWTAVSCILFFLKGNGKQNYCHTSCTGPMDMCWTIDGRASLRWSTDRRCSCSVYVHACVRHVRGGDMMWMIHCGIGVFVSPYFCLKCTNLFIFCFQEQAATSGITSTMWAKHRVPRLKWQQSNWGDVHARFGNRATTWARGHCGRRQWAASSLSNST